MFLWPLSSTSQGNGVCGTPSLLFTFDAHQAEFRELRQRCLAEGRIPTQQLLRAQLLYQSDHYGGGEGCGGLLLPAVGRVWPLCSISTAEGATGKLLYPVGFIKQHGQSVWVTLSTHVIAAIQFMICAYRIYHHSCVIDGLGSRVTVVWYM